MAGWTVSKYMEMGAKSCLEGRMDKSGFPSTPRLKDLRMQA